MQCAEETRVVSDQHAKVNTVPINVYESVCKDTDQLCPMLCGDSASKEQMKVHF